MSTYFHLRAVHPSALRNSEHWFQRLFEDNWDTVRLRLDRHREEMLDRHYLDQDALYAGTDVILGGTPIGHRPFLLLSAARTAETAAYLASTDFEALWSRTKADPDLHDLFAATHRDLTAFYARTAEYGDAVVKCCLQ
ncbi:DUF1877 domain-containing protein [Streptomyces sp. NPDC001617]